MKKLFFFKIVFIFFLAFNGKVLSEENNKTIQNNKISAFAGIFDYKRVDQNSFMYGFQHQNDELFKKTFLGILSPITGGLLTADGAAYAYTGLQAEYGLGFLKLTPSFAPGYFYEGGGKKMGSPLEFKSEIKLSYDLSENTQFGMAANHISNADISDTNPGSDSYTFNFLKKF